MHKEEMKKDLRVLCGEHVRRLVVQQNVKCGKYERLTIGDMEFSRWL